MFPRCDSDQGDKRNIIYLTPVTAPFKDANRFKIYVKFAERERSRKGVPDLKPQGLFTSAVMPGSVVLSRRKLPFFFTMDEVMIQSKETTSQTNSYYKRQHVVVPDSWKKLPRTNWPKNVMVAMGICWRGKLWIYIVPEKAKVNADFFVKFILKPMVKKDIPALYGKHPKNVVFHVDSAPAHTAKKTVQWLQEHKVKFISEEEWMAYSPDLATMNYGISGISEHILKSRIAKNSKQLARVIRSKWKKFPLCTIRKALLS